MENVKTRLDVILERLMGDEYDPFREYLEQLLADKRASLERSRDTINLYRAQGEISAIRQILGRITRNRG